MTANRYGAVLTSIAIIFTQVGAGQAPALQTPSAAEVTSLAAAIKAAVDPIKADPSMTPAQKQQAMNTAVLAAIRSSGASDGAIANALIRSADSDISSETAVVVASQVSTSVATLVNNAPAIQEARLAASGPLAYEAAKAEEARDLIAATAKAVKEQPGYDQKSLAEKSETMSAAIAQALSGKSFPENSIRSALIQASMSSESPASVADIYQAALRLSPSAASEIAQQPAVYQQMQLIAFDVATTAANSAKSDPGFSRKSAADQSNAVTAAIAKALAEKSFTPEVAVAAWGRAVNANLVSSEAARLTMGVEFLVPGSTTNIETAAISSGGAPTILVGLQGAASASGGDGLTPVGASSGPATKPAPYDPCANVIAAYCGG